MIKKGLSFFKYFLISEMLLTIIKYNKNNLKLNL